MRTPAAVVSIACLLLGGAAVRGEDAKVAGTDVPVPKRTKFVAPQYPPDAQAQGLRGIVILELLIGTEGQVASVQVVRSIPAFDQAALSAVQQWHYEVTRVGGRPVPVRLTVPITFSFKLPEMTREPGIPELRQGAGPILPASAPSRARASVVAQLVVDADGEVKEAEIRSGDSPWSEAVLQALRTWHFVAIGGDRQISFQAQVDFLTTSKDVPPRVDIKLSGVQDTHVVPGNSPLAAQATSPTPPESVSPPAAIPSPATAAPSPIPSPTAEAPSPVPSPPAAPPSLPGPPSPSPSSPPTAPPATAAGTAGSTVPSAPAPSPSPATPAPPPVEVIPVAPPSQAPRPAVPQRPPEEGVSAIQDVVLDPGIPDLAKGRRPVVPPLARMAGASGTVEVQFMVEASGSTSVRETKGPELLMDAAKQTVSSWVFRRTRPERLALLAVITYQGDNASAAVKKAE